MDKTSVEANAVIFNFVSQFRLGRQNEKVKKDKLVKESVTGFFQPSEVTLHPQNHNAITITGGSALRGYKGQLIVVSDLTGSETKIPIFKITEFFESTVSNFKKLTAVYEGYVEV